jgi:protein SCO1/2
MNTLMTRPLALAACLLPLLWEARAVAQQMTPATMTQNVGVDQKLNGQVPLDLQFRDEQGNPVKLGQYFGSKPVVLALVYYRCPGLCTMTLNGMSKAFKPMQFSVGNEFEVVTVSIDPNETPALAAEKKEQYMKMYGREGAAKGWHFLTGDAAPIKALAEAVGFRYVYEPSTNQFAHAAAIMVATPAGKLSRYFYGLEYSSRDLRWGLVEASENKIGSLADAVNLLCYAYDPTTGKYGVPIMRMIRAGGVLTMLGIGSLVFFMLRRERRLAAQPAARSGGPVDQDVRRSS